MRASLAAMWTNSFRTFSTCLPIMRLLVFKNSWQKKAQIQIVNNNRKQDQDLILVLPV